MTDPDPDPSAAVHFFQRAAALGHARAQALAGVFMVQPFSYVTLDRHGGIALVQQSATQDDPVGVIIYEFMRSQEEVRYLDKLPEEQVKRAAALLRAQYDSRDTSAPLTSEQAVDYHMLGVALDYGIGVEKQAEEALRIYQLCAQRHLCVSENNVGYANEFGYGTEVSVQESIKWYTKAAQQGCIVAQNNLGYIYYHQQEPNYDLAVRYFSQAAKNKYPTACIWLGRCYESGHGVRKDLAMAVQLFRVAMDMEHPLGFQAVGGCHLNGSGVEKVALCVSCLPLTFFWT